MSIILKTDSYKLSHWEMYNSNLAYLTSYFEARHGGEYNVIVFFGLQYLLKEFLTGSVVSQKDVDEAYIIAEEHFNNEDIFNLEGWQYIVDEYDGILPLKIRAVPEGTLVPESNVLLTVENTDPKVPWLVNHIETMLVRLWYPCTVATASFHQGKTLLSGMNRSANEMEGFPFMLHDFGARGSTSGESASIGGAAHLLSFLGTDNLEALMFIKKYYNEHGISGYSVPAAEHSTITSWGQEGEVAAYRHILEKFPKGIVSVVSDSWDIINACENIWGGELKDMVINDYRCLVIRPDSGDPRLIVPQCLDILGEKFGYTINNKGYRVLPPYLKIIQGDGISRYSLASITESIMNRGWSLCNVVFGSGGGLLQDYNRDTNRFAMKCSAVKNNGDIEWRDVFKSPVTDVTKNSKKGYLSLSQNFTTTSDTIDDNILRPVFLNGSLLIDDNWYNIKNRLFEHS